MIPFLQAITSKLLEVHPRVYLNRAPSNAVFPYVVYTTDISNITEQREDFTLTLDIWGNGTNSVPIEQLTHDFSKALNKYHYKNENIQLSVYRTNRLMIDDPDPLIIRRQLRFQVQTYFLEG